LALVEGVRAGLGGGSCRRPVPSRVGERNARGRAAKAGKEQSKKTRA